MSEIGSLDPEIHLYSPQCWLQAIEPDYNAKTQGLICQIHVKGILLSDHLDTVISKLWCEH